METMTLATETDRYARCIQVSKAVRWEIERDVVRGRKFDFSRKFLPDALSRVNTITGLSPSEGRLLGQIQGRSYANIFGLVERFINAKMLEVSSRHWFGDQVALEALVRFSDEEIKHQELFRRIEAMIGAGMPQGYRFLPGPDAVAGVVLGKSTWAVLALTCHIELFTQVHYKKSIEDNGELDPLFRDVFRFHWKEEAQHAVLDELEWAREDAGLITIERDRAVDDFIELVGAVDGILQQQSKEDADYFVSLLDRAPRPGELQEIRDKVLGAYRYQYIVSGVQETPFMEILGRFIDDHQAHRITRALGPILG